MRRYSSHFDRFLRSIRKPKKGECKACAGSGHERPYNPEIIGPLRECALCWGSGEENYLENMLKKGVKMKKKKTKNKMENKLGSTLKKLRKDSGLTLMELSKKTRIGNAYLSQIETGKVKRPAPQMLYSIAVVYGIDFDWLMKIGGYVKRKNPKKFTVGMISGDSFLAAAKLNKREQKLLWELLKFLRGNKVK